MVALTGFLFVSGDRVRTTAGGVDAMVALQPTVCDPLVPVQMGYLVNTSPCLVKCIKQKILQDCSYRIFFLCRGDRIRTCDPLVPNQMRYRAAPLPETCITEPGFSTSRDKRLRVMHVYQRRERDSNPRYPYEYGSLANCWFQPLTHLSSFRATNIEG